MSEQGEVRDYASGLRSDRGGDERWLSVYEVAAMTLQHPDTIRRWIVDGLIRAEQRGRLGQRISESEVERYLSQNFINDKRNPANHALSSNVINAIPVQNQPLERELKGAGWPFNQRVEDSGRPIDRAAMDAPPTEPREVQGTPPPEPASARTDPPSRM